MKKFYIGIIFLFFSIKGSAQFSEYGGTYYDSQYGTTGVNVNFNPGPNWAAINAAQDAYWAAQMAAAAANIPQQPNIPPTPTQPPPSSPNPNTPQPPPPPDPCSSAAKSDAKTSNAVLSAQNSSIRTQSTTNEFGAEQNLTTFPVSGTPGYRNTAVRSSGATSAFTPNFTWDAVNGYTVGVSHGHPANGAPSPADLVYAYANLSNPQLVAAGQSAIDYYKANFSISVVTQNEIYTITVKDWTALGTLYNAFRAKPAAANSAYVSEANSYATAHPGASYGDITAYPGIKLYGSAVTITKKDNSTVKSSPLKIDANGNVVKTPCP